MTRLPFLISVPHAGLEVPLEVEQFNLLSPAQIARDGDEQAAEIYLPLQDRVGALVTTGVARAFVDANRPPDDRGRDGVVKTHTTWDEPIYREPLAEHLVDELLRRYWRPYHDRLADLAGTDLLLGIDCHTMAAAAPPIAPRPGVPRPAICLSDAGRTCPGHLFRLLADILRSTFGHKVSINDPFRGGHIIRSHAREMPWVQLELSRSDFLPVAKKCESVLASLERFSREVA